MPDAQDGNQREIYRDYYHVFSTPEGKRVLAHIARMGFIYTSTFDPKSPERTLVNEGARIAALAILKFADQQPTELNRNENTIEADGSRSGGRWSRWRRWWNWWSR